MDKTNALRILDFNKIEYKINEYDNTLTDGEKIATLLGEDKEECFKTLVTVSDKKEYLVYIVPVAHTLDLKKAARLAGVKSIEMIPQKELFPLTGYIHGGCSPIGMKKQFRTFAEETMELFDLIYVSGGRVGLQIGISPLDLSRIVDIKYGDITRE